MEEKTLPAPLKALKVIALILGSVVLIIGATLLYFRLRDGLFLLKRVEVHGCERSSAAEIIVLSGLSGKDSLLTLDLSDVEKKIEVKEPLVIVSEISRIFPDKILIKVVEREAAALTVYNGKLYEVSGDGVILTSTSPQDFDMPILTDFPPPEGKDDSAPQARLGISAKNMLANLEMLKAQEKVFYDIISEINYTEHELILYPRLQRFKILLNHDFDRKKLYLLPGALTAIREKALDPKIFDYRFGTLNPTIRER